MWTSKKIAKRLKKKIAGCGFVTVYDEVSKRKVVDMDTFRFVLYTPLLEDILCDELGIEKSELIVKKGNRDKL